MQMELIKLFEIIRNTNIIRAVRDGLIMAIPVLMLGSFSLILNTLPIAPYQDFLENFASGLISDLFLTIHDATLGLLSVYMVFSISFAISKIKSSNEISLGAAFTSLVCFAILSGVFIGESDEILNSFGSKGTFIAIITGVIATYLYFFCKEKLRLKLRSFGDGADTIFNIAVSEIIPSIMVVIIFATFNIIAIDLLHATTFSAFLIELINELFSALGRSFGTAVLFVVLSSFLWFFGIHGGDVLDGVNKALFEPAIYENLEAITMGQAPTEILSKTFFDVFVLTGGAGTTICLLVAVLAFSNHKSNKKLARMAALPMLFNVNELILFGFPVVFNPILLIPFFLTPIVTLFTSYMAMLTGIVPVATVSVEWTTPIFIGGYIATGSIMGVTLQGVNLLVGMLIYKPFVKLYDKDKIYNGNKDLEKLIQVLKSSENSGTPIILTELKDSTGAIARMLVGDLAEDIEKRKFNMYYQPQHNEKNECIGAEALLRWKHKEFGMIYPPLVIKLADEADMLVELEESIFNMVAEEINNSNLRSYGKLKFSINVTVSTIQQRRFIYFLNNFANKNNIRNGEFCIEITEQAALTMDENLQESFSILHEQGFLLAIDDFSMGATSLKYLQKSNFDLVKIDGGLVKDLEIDNRSKNIISSIIYLAESLGFSVVAEFVDSEAKRCILENIGCTQYQGYLYSPAITLKEFETYVENTNLKHSIKVS